MTFWIPDADLDRWLAEDLPGGDLTTQALGIGTQPGCMIFSARQPLTLAASEEAARLLTRVGATVTLCHSSGFKADAHTPVLIADGPAAALLAGWKVAQTLMEYASGIATSAAAILHAARAIRPDITVACTRKTFPGTKSIAIKAIMAAGAVIHRLGLSETVLVFPEHRVFLQRKGEPWSDAITRLKHHCPERKIVVEVNSLDDAIAAALAGADVVQLEKFTPTAVAEVVAQVATRSASSSAAPVKVAAAGGVNATNAAEYARAGATILVTSAPYCAPPADIQVTIEATSPL